MNKKREYIEVKEFLKYIETRMGIVKTEFQKNNLMNVLMMDEKVRKYIKRDGKVFKIEKQLIDDQVKLYNESIHINKAVEIIQECIEDEDISVTKQYLQKICGSHTIPLIHLREVYVLSRKLLEIKRIIMEIKENECITSFQLYSYLNKKFVGCNIERTTWSFIAIAKKYKNEIILANDLKKFYKCDELYPKETVRKIAEEFRELCNTGYIKLINMTYEEYYDLNESDFKRDYIKITTTELKKLCKWQHEKGCEFIVIKNYFLNTNIKFISINRGNHKYVSKNEFNKHVSLVQKLEKDYIKLSDIEGRNIKREYIVRKGIKNIRYKGVTYIHKEDEKLLVEHLNQFHAKKQADTIESRFRIEYEKIEGKEQYPQFNKIFLEFVRIKGERSKNLIESTYMFSLYKAILENMEKDFNRMDDKEKSDLLWKVFLKNGHVNRFKRDMIFFNNYLSEKLKYSVQKLSLNDYSKPLECYEEEAYISLLAKIIEILADKEKVKKLYGNWKLSTAITYIFIHYTLAWRNRDLVEQLPIADLRHINGIEDGESFIKWLECGNEISEYQALEICNELENITERLRKTASKNEQELFCVISSEFSKNIATLLCICEASKSIYIEKVTKAKLLKNPNVFHEVSTQPQKIRELLIDAFALDINKILKGKFDNRRMNKSFLQLVRDKAEELGIAYSYYLAQISRGHKPIDGCFSEMTKIYLKKDISKASIKAFAMGTMGSVQHIMLELVNSEYNNLDDLKQIEAVKELDITAYAVETHVAKIVQKIQSMKKEVERYFRDGGDFQKFMEKLIYGQNVYGIERGTRCLLKITRDEKGIVRIKGCNYEKERNNFKCPRKRSTCIGCDYLIALRYFIYEFNRKINIFLDEMDKYETELERDILIDIFNQDYVPIMNEMAQVIGEEVYNIYDHKRTEKIMWSE